MSKDSPPETVPETPDALSTSAKVRLPRGVYLLFATEMWERMSYYGMRALLVLYMKAATDKGGFGWSKEHALDIYGWYTAAVYITPLLGGVLADRLLGQRRAVLIGGFLMMVGHFLMAVPGTAAFFAALAFLVFGNGFFKPNISSMVGGLFKQGQPGRDAAYTVFYMGVNVGAGLAPLVCGTLGEKVGYHWGFGSAGVGMLIGLLVFWAGSNRLLGSVGKHPGSAKAAEAGDVEPPAEPSVERERLLVVFVIVFFNIFFWMAFEQAGGLMTLYTDEKVDRSILAWEMPTSWFQVWNPLFIVLLGPIAASIWNRLAAAKRDLSIPRKMALGLFLMGTGFIFMMGAAAQSAGGGKAHLGWVVLAYLFHTLGELCLSPIGLSMISKLAPIRMVSLMMGVWYGSIAIGNKLAGVVGTYSEKLGELTLFGGIVVATWLAALGLFAVSKKLVVWSHGRA